MEITREEKLEAGFKTEEEEEEENEEEEEDSAENDTKAGKESGGSVGKSHSLIACITPRCYSLKKMFTKFNLILRVDHHYKMI